MKIEEIGPWILLFVGALLLLGGASLAARKRGSVPMITILLIFGLGTAGIGVYGPTFLDRYQLLKTVGPLIGSPSHESYNAFLSGVARGDVGPLERELGLSYILQRPIDGTEELLQAATAKAEQDDARVALSAAGQWLEGRQRVAAVLAADLMPSNHTARLSEEQVKLFDPATRTLIIRDLEKHDGRRLATDPGVVARLKHTTPDFLEPGPVIDR